MRLSLFGNFLWPELMEAFLDSRNRRTFLSHNYGSRKTLKPWVLSKRVVSMTLTGFIGAYRMFNHVTRNSSPQINL